MPTALVTQLFSSYVSAGISDVPLFEHLLEFYSRFIYDFAPDDCARMAMMFAKTLPLNSLEHIATAMDAAEEYLFDFIDSFSLQGVGTTYMCDRVGKKYITVFLS